LISCAQAQSLPQAIQIWQKGDYKGAETTLASLSQKGDLSARVAYCRLLRETGRYSDAEAAARGASNAELKLEFSYALRSQGKYAEAEKVIADVSLPEARFALAELLARRGEAARAVELHRLVTREARGRPGSLAAARSLQRLKDFHASNSLFQDLEEKYPQDIDIKLAWAELFLEKYNASEAAGLYQEILKENSGHPEALAGMAQCAGDSSDPKVNELLDRALKTNANLIDVFQIRARRFIEDERYDAAAAQLDLAEKIDAQDLKNWALRGALAYFRQQDPQASFRKIDEVNPHDGQAWLQLGQLCVSRKRFDKAIEFFRNAIGRDPELWQAHADLGINLLRLGAEREGKDALEKAYAGDPFHVWTVNTLRLLDTFKYYHESRTAHFRLLIHSKEEVLRDLAEELLEQSYQAFKERYGFSPAFQTSIEFYPNHEDFAVRTLGVPGLGALGAAFGKVVALDSPMARKRGEYNWASTLWHEVAHIFTLNLSDMKVPRWLTEGLSTYEERLAHPGWGRKIDPMLVQAAEKKLLLPLKELSVGFLHPQFPEQILISYTQSSFVCQFLAERYGWEKIRQLLQAFREKNETDALKAVYGKSLDDLDAEFRSYLEPLISKVAGQLDKSSSSEYSRLLREADEHLKNNEWGKAAPLLRRAAELDPEPRYPFNVWFRLAQAEEKLGRQKEAMEAYMNAGRLSEAGEEAYQRAFDLALQQNRQDVASAAYQSLMCIYPANSELNVAMGEAWLKWNQPERAVAPLARATRISSADPAQSHYLLARAYFLSGKRELAKKAVLAALDVAPSFEKAQQLLLQIAEGRQ
jgi:tetratricopeptide (TPR) repeat protein